MGWGTVGNRNDRRLNLLLIFLRGALLAASVGLP